MPVYCCVPHCKQRTGGYTFPSEEKLRLAWRVAISRIDPTTKKLWEPAPASVVCKHHFHREDYKDSLLVLVGVMPVGSSMISCSKTDNEDDWYIDCSDEEKYNPYQERKGVWQPKPEDVINLFEKLEKEKFIELRWQCPGRRPPDSDKEEEKEEEKTPEKEVVDEQPKEEEKKQVAPPSEFDFDDMDSTTTVITPRRTPGTSKTPKSIKKVARMDKVLNDMKRQRDADREARRMFGRTASGSPARSIPAHSLQTTPVRPTQPAVPAPIQTPHNEQTPTTTTTTASMPAQPKTDDSSKPGDNNQTQSTAAPSFMDTT